MTRLPNHPNPLDANAASAGVTTIPVVQEELALGTVREQTGTVRVRKLSHARQETVPLRHDTEQLEIERRPINRVVEATEAVRHEADVMVVPVYEERLVKQLVLLEEIHITRRRHAVEGKEVVSLRREEVIVERFDAATQQWLTDPS